MAQGIDIADMARRGVAVMVATRDADLRPEVSRAWGPLLSEDGTQLSVCVEAPPGSAMARNLESGRPCAATMARLASPMIVQMTGPVLEAAAPTQDRLDAVATHIERFVVEAGSVGVPEAIARGMVGPDLVAVTMQVSARTDETPGDRAGEPL